MLRVASLGSGSGGNSTLICSATTTLLLDCGFTLKETTARCMALGITPAGIDGILLSHEHSDHVKGLGPIARKLGVPIWSTYGTYHAMKDRKFEGVSVISAHEPFSIGNIDIDPFPTPHDAAESCQYVFNHGGKSFACVTDLGAVTPHVIKKIAACDALLVESNYDEQMLRDGPYPPSLQSRIRSNYGHLGNEQAGKLLSNIDHAGLQTILLGHLSEKNNSPNHAYQTVSEYIDRTERITVLDQHKESAWFELGKRSGTSAVAPLDGLRDAPDQKERSPAQLSDPSLTITA